MGSEMCIRDSGKIGSKKENVRGGYVQNPPRWYSSGVIELRRETGVTPVLLQYWSITKTADEKLGEQSAPGVRDRSPGRVKCSVAFEAKVSVDGLLIVWTRQGLFQDETHYEC